MNNNKFQLLLNSCCDGQMNVLHLVLLVDLSYPLSFSSSHMRMYAHFLHLTEN